MKRITILAFFICFFPLSAFSQSFNEGLDLYEQEQYVEALEIFTALDDGQSLLFAGKSHFNLQNYLKANEYLKQAIEVSNEIAYRQEAEFTLGLSYFRMKDYTRSIDQLHLLIISDERGRAKVDAQRFYRQILQFFALAQRFEIIQSTDYISVAEDVVTSSSNNVNHLDYTALVSLFLERITDNDQRETYASELDRPTSAIKSRRETENSSLSAPDGMVYNVGVILPGDEESGTDLLVPRNLYYGITLAAEEFNSQYTEKKISLNYRNSKEDPDSTIKSFHDVVWRGFSDAVIGPLFSETALQMAELSEQYRIPMIAPLANSDEINLDYNYTFQMNPTFEVHGKRYGTTRSSNARPRYACCYYSG